MKNDNQTMDRAIPVSEQRRRKLRRIAVAVAIAVAVLGAGAWLGTQMIPALDRKALIISEVDRGTIDVSVSATGRIVHRRQRLGHGAYRTRLRGNHRVAHQLADSGGLCP